MKDLHDSVHHAPTEEDRGTGLWPVSAGHFRIHSRGTRRPNPEDFLCIYCVGGLGWFEHDEHAFNIRTGQLLIALPGVPHAYGADPDRGWDIWWVHFDGDMGHRLVELTGHQATQPVQTLGINSDLIARFSQILDALRHRNSLGDLDATTALFGLLLELRRHWSRKQEEVDRLVQVIEAHPESVDEMARAAGMSKFHFIRRFRTATGLTPWRFLTRQRINRAKKLLTDTDLSIKEITYELGYRDPNYFSRIFRAETGVTAKHFRMAEA